MAIKPIVPQINWNNPLAKGLIVCVNLSEGSTTTSRELIGKQQATFSNISHISWVNNIFGRAIQTDGANSGAAVITYPITSSFNFTQVSLGFIYTRHGAGGGGFGDIGRVTDLSNNWKFAIENDGSQSNQLGFFPRRSGSGGEYIVSTPTNGIQHFDVITYVNNNANSPVWYRDGLLISNTASPAPTGTVSGNSTFFSLLNASNGGDSWDGTCSSFFIWNRLLSAQEAKQLYSNPWQIYSQPGLLNQPF